VSDSDLWERPSSYAREGHCAEMYSRVPGWPLRRPARRWSRRIEVGLVGLAGDGALTSIKDQVGVARNAAPLRSPQLWPF